MKHSGKARQAAFKILFWTLLGLLALFVAGIVATLLSLAVTIIAPTLVGLWIVFALFTLYFFRDPNPTVPPGKNLVLSPAHGKVDAIGETVEPYYMGGRCQRISI